MIINKTLYRALTRWGYTNTHIAVYDTYRLQYRATVFQLRFKVVPELSGKVEYERERLNTVQKFAPCEVIQEVFGFRIPLLGFRILLLGFRIPHLGFQIPEL